MNTPEKDVKATTEEEKTIQKLSKENENLIGLLGIALKEIERLKENLTYYENTPGNYDIGSSIVTKFVFFINQAGKPLKSIDLVHLLISREPSLNVRDRDNSKYFSAFLTLAKKHKRLIPYNVKGVRGNFYCLPEWIDNECELLPEMKTKIC